MAIDVRLKKLRILVEKSEKWVQTFQKKNMIPILRNLANQPSAASANGNNLGTATKSVPGSLDSILNGHKLSSDVIDFHRSNLRDIENLLENLSELISLFYASTSVTMNN